MLCSPCKTHQPASTVAGSCSAPGCGNFTAHKTYQLCRTHSAKSGRCENCRQLVVHSNAHSGGDNKDDK